MAEALTIAREKFNALLREVDDGQKKLDAAAKNETKLQQSEVDAIHAKAKEAFDMQSEVEKLERLHALSEKSREVVTPRTPGEAKDAAKKGKHVRMSLGQAVIGSPGYRAFLKNGMPQQDTRIAQVYGSLAKGIAILSPEQMKAFDANESPLAVIGDGEDDIVVRPMRDPEVVRFEEPRMLSLRDLLNVSPTSSDTIQWLRLKEVNRAAKVVPPTTAKPYMNIEFEKKTTAIKTLAVLAKVTEQQIEDAPQLMQIIDTEMRRDLRELEEEEILWGDGTGDHFDGLFHDATVPVFDRDTSGTKVDIIRRMRTDIRLKRLTPSGVLIHPLDWEEIELLKGNDDRYVWGLVDTLRGPRIWSMPVVESESAENPETGDRLIVVADWARGATLWDRHDIRVALGWVNNDFGENLRTVRAENRLGFGVKRPTAFTKYEIEPASS
jgi:HK97 family phage major capsid protein